MTMTLVEPKYHEQMLQETKDAQDFLSALRTYKVRTVEEYDRAADDLAEIKGRYKRIEASKKELTTPINEALKKARALFDPPLKYLAECEILLKGAIASYHTFKDEENQKAMAAAASAHVSGNTEQLAAAVQSIQQAPQVSGLSVREVWDYEVVDGGKVPRDLLSVDDSKVKAWIKMFDGVEPALVVPGLRFFKRPIVSSRSK